AGIPDSSIYGTKPTTVPCKCPDSALRNRSYSTMGAASDSGDEPGRPSSLCRNRQILRGYLGSGQQPAEIGNGRAQVAAVNHHIDHAVVPEMLCALEAVGQFLADGLLDDPRAGKTDERARLSDMNISEHRVGGGNSAGGRVRQHDDIGLSRLAQHLHR